MCDMCGAKHLVRKKKSEKVAGAGGFEPPNAGSKSRCLTEMRMKNVSIAWVYFFRILKKCVCNVVVWLSKNSIDLCDYLVVLLNYYWLFKYCSLREFIWQRKLFVRSVNHNLRCDEVEGRINRIKRHSNPGIVIRYLV